MHSHTHTQAKQISSHYRLGKLILLRRKVPKIINQIFACISVSDVHDPRIPRTHTFGFVWSLYFYLNRRARESVIVHCYFTTSKTGLLYNKRKYYYFLLDISAIWKVCDKFQKIINLKSELNCEFSGSFPTGMVAHCPSELSSAFWYYLLKSQRTGYALPIAQHGLTFCIWFI